MSSNRISLFSAGSNAKGQLAHGTLEDSPHFLRCTFDSDSGDPLSKGGGFNVISLAFGANHTLMLLRDDHDVSTLWACGDGTKGQAGEEYRTSTSTGLSTAFRRIDLDRPPGYEYSGVAAAWETSFISISHPDRGDILLSAGADSYGCRGAGTIQDGASQKSVNAVRFDHLFDENELLSLRILDVKAATQHTLAKLSCRRKDGSSAICFVGWGASRHGQLGPAVTLSFTPTPVVVPVQNAHDIVSFAVGNHHSVFVYSDGRVLALGSNRKKQTQALDSIADALAIDATWNGTFVLRQPHLKSWHIYASGSNGNAQLAISPSEASSRTIAFQEHSDAQEIACGSEHVLVRLRSNTTGDTLDEVWGWGWNEHGNLGLGHTKDVPQPTCIWPSDSCTSCKHKVRGVWAGLGTTWIAVEWNALHGQS